MAEDPFARLAPVDQKLYQSAESSSNRKQGDTDNAGMPANQQIGTPSNRPADKPAIRQVSMPANRQADDLPSRRGSDEAELLSEKETFRCTADEVKAVNRLKTDLWETHDFKVSKQDLERFAVQVVTEDYKRHGAQSAIVQHLKEQPRK